MTTALQGNARPEADLFDLARRLGGRSGVPSSEFEPVRLTPPAEQVGSTREFWVYDFDTRRNKQIAATLRVVGTHSKWWVANDVPFEEQALRATAAVFDNQIYPTNRRLYGEEWTPGVDGDPRVAVLFARIPGRAAGYFSSADALPTWINEFSAEKELMYINALATTLATDELHSVLAHEFCHMQQFNRRASSVTWFTEGQAQLCESANGYPGGFAESFLRQPNTQLNDWADLDDSAALHYGAAYLFLEFLRQKAGGEDLINAFLDRGINTAADLDAVLRERGQPGIEELFADFVAANAFIGTAAEPRFVYDSRTRPSIPASMAVQDRAPVGTTLRTTVKQYAARYIQLPQSSVTVRFEGARATRVIPTDARSGNSFWWSDRGDSLNTRLTRTIDLGGTTTATLSFWAWYDIEPDFDYAYVSVSTNGSTWQTLETALTTTSDPNGSNFGNGFTGKSGGGSEAIWVKQSVNLSSYAGQEIQLRFEYVTDGALNENGFAIDDIEVPEIGYRDDAESDREWDPEGFIRSSNVVVQRYIVQLLRFGQTASVGRHVVENGVLELAVNPSGDRQPPLLAVTGIAARTTLSAAFTVTVERGP